MRISGIVVCVLLTAALTGCAVGPGTPLMEALNPVEATRTGTVQPPKGYGPPMSTQEASGLINTRDRAETAEFLKSLAQNGESVQGTAQGSSLN